MARIHNLPCGAHCSLPITFSPRRCFITQLTTLQEVGFGCERRCERRVQAAPEFDTFGGTAAEVARRAAQADAAGRAGALPNLMPDELVAPVADSIGETGDMCD